MSFPVADLHRLIEIEQVWVACSVGGEAVGMVIASLRDGVVYVDVIPAHGRRGPGTRLLERVCDWALAWGAAVTLSTFRNVPWNAPFHRQRGFRELHMNDWTSGMHAIRAAEARHGLRVEARVFMCREPRNVDR